jgi:hypothetical protein
MINNNTHTVSWLDLTSLLGELFLGTTHRKIPSQAEVATNLHDHGGFTRFLYTKTFTKEHLPKSQECLQTNPDEKEAFVQKKARQLDE